MPDPTNAHLAARCRRSPWTRRLALALTAASLAACSGTELDVATEGAPEPATAALDLPEGAEAAAATIDAEYLRDLVAQLSSDELQGRAPGSPGDTEARRIMAEEMAAIGLEPAGETGWEQPMTLVGITAEVPETWTFDVGDETVTLDSGEDFIAASGVQRPQATIDDAEVVFVGYGIEAPEYEWNDFAGQDLRGKVLLMLNNDPHWDEELFAGERRLYYGRWTYKYESAARQGAAGAIIIHTDESAGYPWQVVQSSWSGEQFELPAGDEPRIDVAAWATFDAAQSLLAAAGHDLGALVEQAKSRDFAPVPLGITTSLALDNTIEPGARTANVMGMLRGSDPERADEAVIFMAHHDHLGVGEPDATRDAIFNGARDNASGVAQVLAAARAFVALPEPPARSILFLLVAAEEQGLLGSKYFANHPTIPPGKIAAAVNYDAGNIWGRTRDATFIGYGKSSLDAIVEAAAARQDRTVVGDQYPDRGFFYRSDQFSLAKIGVPAVYLDGGTDFRSGAEGRALAEAWEAERYHQPSDELDDTWDFSGMVEDTRLGFFVGLEVAEREELPTWNPGDEFEAARLAALADAEE